MIKTSTWKKIVTDRSLFVDPFDEVPLNRYFRMNNKKLLFINNGFGLHLMYNTVFGIQNHWGIGMADGEAYETSVYDRLLSKIKND